ncbi:MAG: hypothetical protein A3G18_06885 [Rhodospirillales bacterium RIFCSPLOWO2_12_FULL_58_28]|nr:MAG: hypothetical protein A3H92_11450 [Rhodospirillales bacterium RIFCSPLOWO2_02_FULL_58_16]OHC77446.1 MAG: hypothetical protein A3G18_06885 [Rhodospirillales bacterium RIFCSPLOWO2_12_FULL_58_28]
MSTRIESTVEKLPEEIARSGASGKQHVFVTILDDKEMVKLEELRRLIDEAEGSGDCVDGDEAFGEIRRNLIAKYPELTDVASDI